MGLEARGLSPNARKYMQSGELQLTEWSNYALDVRLKAAADGVSFGIVRSILGTDTFKMSAAKVIECPFTGKKYAAVPACWPDVVAIHVHEADMYGNCVIKGISVADLELARAAKHLIISHREDRQQLGHPRKSRPSPPSRTTWWTRSWKRPTAAIPATWPTATSRTRSISPSG